MGRKYILRIIHFIPKFIVFFILLSLPFIVWYPLYISIEKGIYIKRLNLSEDFRNKFINNLSEGKVLFGIDQKTYRENISFPEKYLFPQLYNITLSSLIQWLSKFYSQLLGRHIWINILIPYIISLIVIFLIGIYIMIIKLTIGYQDNDYQSTSKSISKKISKFLSKIFSSFSLFLILLLILFLFSLRLFIFSLQEVCIQLSLMKIDISIIIYLFIFIICLYILYSILVKDIDKGIKNMFRYMSIFYIIYAIFYILSFFGFFKGISWSLIPRVTESVYAFTVSLSALLIVMYLIPVLPFIFYLSNLRIKESRFIKERIIKFFFIFITIFFILFPTISVIVFIFLSIIPLYYIIKCSLIKKKFENRNRNDQKNLREQRKNLGQLKEGLNTVFSLPHLFYYQVLLGHRELAISFLFGLPLYLIICLFPLIYPALQAQANVTHPPKIDFPSLFQNFDILAAAAIMWLAPVIASILFSEGVIKPGIGRALREIAFKGGDEKILVIGSGKPLRAFFVEMFKEYPDVMKEACLPVMCENGEIINVNTRFIVLDYGREYTTNFYKDSLLGGIGFRPYEEWGIVCLYPTEKRAPFMERAIGLLNKRLLNKKYRGVIVLSRNVKIQNSVLRKILDDTVDPSRRINTGCFITCLEQSTQYSVFHKLIYDKMNDIEGQEDVPVGFFELYLDDLASNFIYKILASLEEEKEDYKILIAGDAYHIGYIVRRIILLSEIIKKKFDIDIILQNEKDVERISPKIELKKAGFRIPLKVEYFLRRENKPPRNVEVHL